jgi:hypothetical protein
VLSNALAVQRPCTAAREYQIADRPTHKRSCGANCFIIRAAPRSDAPLDNIAAQLEPFHLTSYKNENAEREQLVRKLGWTATSFPAVAKFYDQHGADHWFYFVYGAEDAETNTSLPRNEVASLISYNPLYGDVAVVRNSPDGSEYNPTITSAQLASSIAFYKTNDLRTVFDKRQFSRTTRKSEARPGAVPVVYIGSG